MSNGEHQESVLEARGLVKRYPEGRGELQVLNGVELTVRRGDIAAIIGTSGSGKSTLLNLLGGLDVPSEGTVQIGASRWPVSMTGRWGGCAIIIWASCTSSTICCRSSPPGRTWPCRC